MVCLSSISSGSSWYLVGWPVIPDKGLATCKDTRGSRKGNGRGRPGDEAMYRGEWEGGGRRGEERCEEAKERVAKVGFTQPRHVNKLVSTIM